MKQTLLIPRAIAEWIEYCKSRDITLYGENDVEQFSMWVNPDKLSFVQTQKG